MRSCRNAPPKRYRPTLWLAGQSPFALCLALGALEPGCLAPKYSVDDRRSSAAGGGTESSNSSVASGGSAGGETAASGGQSTAGGAPTTSSSSAATGGSTLNASAGCTGGTPPNLRYCDSLTTSSADAALMPDWSCVTPLQNTASDTPGVVVSGVFSALSSDTVFDKLDYCPVSFSICNNTNSALPDFEFTSTQEGCGIVYWHESGTARSATMWHTITRAPSLYIGTIPLLTQAVVPVFATILNQKITADGAALIGVKDCAGNTAPGVCFMAATDDQRLMGLHFSIQNGSSIPTAAPTGAAGLGGLVNITPGIANIYAYVADGCIVAEARIVSEASRFAYVYLVPNGFH